jgi:hypothetical protein
LNPIFAGDTPILPVKSESLYAEIPDAILRWAKSGFPSPFLMGFTFTDPRNARGAESHATSVAAARPSADRAG